MPIKEKKNCKKRKKIKKKNDNLILELFSLIISIKLKKKIRRELMPPEILSKVKKDPLIKLKKIERLFFFIFNYTN
jgi:hypothetical protein